MTPGETSLPHIESELEKSRQSAAHLLDTLAAELRVSRVIGQTVGQVERAATYLERKAVPEMAAGLGRSVRKRPVIAILTAVIVGYWLGRMLRRR